MAKTPDKMDIEALQNEASHLLRRLKLRKLSNETSLLTALEEVQKITPANLISTHSAIATLRDEVAKAWVYEYSLGRSSRLMTYVCVLISVVIMFFMVTTSMIYNQGSELLADLQKLSFQQPERRIGQLERQIYAARHEVFNENQNDLTGKTCTADTIDCTKPAVLQPTYTDASVKPLDKMTKEASYALVHELRELTGAIGLIQFRLIEFNRLITSSPIGSYRFQMLFGRNWLQETVAASPNTQTGSSSDEQNKPALAPKAPSYPTKACEHFISTWNGSFKTGGFVDTVEYPVVLDMKMGEITQQACDLSAVYTSTSIPPLQI